MFSVKKRLSLLKLTCFGRPKSSHSLLKSWLEKTAESIDSVLLKIDYMVNLQFLEIKGKLETTRTNSNFLLVKIYGYVLSRRLEGVVSHRAYKLSNVEWSSRGKRVEEDPRTCPCELSLCYGLVCACRMLEMVNERKPIDLADVRSFWKDFPNHLEYKTEDDDSVQAIALEMFDVGVAEFKKSASELQLRKYAQVLHEMSQPRRIHVHEPLAFERTAQQKDNPTRRDPSTSEINDLGKKFTSGKSGHCYSSSDSAHSEGNSLPYRADMPPCIIPYILSYSNAQTDLKCGYKVIACLQYGTEDMWNRVRRDLYEEMTSNSQVYRSILGDFTYLNNLYRLKLCASSALMESECDLNEIGLVVATRYQKVVITYTRGGSVTYPPLRFGSNVRSDCLHSFEEEITIGIIRRGNVSYFVALHLPNIAPMPRMTPFWSRFCEQNIRELEQNYSDRLRHFDLLSTHYDRR